MQKVEQDDIDEMLNFKSLIERNMLPILNYFRFGATNAKAENLNSQIQRSCFPQCSTLKTLLDDSV